MISSLENQICLKQYTNQTFRKLSNSSVQNRIITQLNWNWRDSMIKHDRTNQIHRSEELSLYDGTMIKFINKITKLKSLQNQTKSKQFKTEKSCRAQERDLRVPTRRSKRPFQLRATVHIVSYSLHPYQTTQQQQQQQQNLKSAKIERTKQTTRGHFYKWIVKELLFFFYCLRIFTGKQARD